MQIHPNNIPHLYEDVEVPGFGKGKIVGCASYFGSTYDVQNKKLSDSLPLIRFNDPINEDKYVNVIPISSWKVKILNCSCGHSKEDYNE